jgi:hypothetical protein
MRCARGCSRYPESRISRWRGRRCEAIARLSDSCTAETDQSDLLLGLRIGPSQHDGGSIGEIVF